MGRAGRPGGRSRCAPIARATAYSVTPRRVVIQGGAALPVSVTLPFTVLGSASVRLHGDGTGDIALGLAPPHRVS
jgi:hypothetical protein